MKVSNLTPISKEEIEKSKMEKTEKETLLSSCSYFRAVKIKVNDQYKFTPKNSFVCVFIIDGKGFINGKPFKQYDTFFVPANYGEVLLSGEFEAIITDCPDI